MKAVVAAFNQEKALVGAFSVITNLWMELFEALELSIRESVTAQNKISSLPQPMRTFCPIQPSYSNDPPTMNTSYSCNNKNLLNHLLEAFSILNLIPCSSIKRLQPIKEKIIQKFASIWIRNKLSKLQGSSGWHCEQNIQVYKLVCVGVFALYCSAALLMPSLQCWQPR